MDSRIVYTRETPYGVMHVQEEFLRRIVREVLEERDAHVHPEMMRPEKVQKLLKGSLFDPDYYRVLYDIDGVRIDVTSMSGMITVCNMLRDLYDSATERISELEGSQ